jgi:hypothetical protein
LEFGRAAFGGATFGSTKLPFLHSRPKASANQAAPGFEDRPNSRTT